MAISSDTLSRIASHGLAHAKLTEHIFALWAEYKDNDTLLKLALRETLESANQFALSRGATELDNTVAYYSKFGNTIVKRRKAVAEERRNMYKAPEAQHLTELATAQGALEPLPPWVAEHDRDSYENYLYMKSRGMELSNALARFERAEQEYNNASD